MTTKACKDKKHTPITTEAQRGLFGAELRRLRAGKKRKTKMTEGVLAKHLREAKGKKL